MFEPVSTFVTYLQETHERFGYETDFNRLAHQLGIIVLPGRYNSATAGPPGIITIQHAEFGARRSFTSQHELSHILMQRCGVEAELVRHFGDYDEAEPHIEALANYGAGLLLMPEPLYVQAVGLHGHTPEAILHLQQHSLASLQAALRRYVYAEPDERRAAFRTSGSYIADVAALNCTLPFWRWDRVPEPSMVLDEVEMLYSPSGRTGLGVVTCER